MLPSLLPVLSLVAVLPAALSTPSILNRNLAFRSPYTNEPHLGIDVEALHERHTVAKRSLDAELGALARRGGKRQAQELRPAGKPHGYTYAGYGLGVASWDDESYVYAGELNYTHSVASGDPYDTSVLLWTRAFPIGTYRVDVPMCVEYKVYSGGNATGETVTSGWALTNADVDFTVKVEAEGLKAGTQYSFQFSNCADGNNKSPVGKTRTAPGWKATDIPTQRFAVYSCSNYPNGFFSAYSGPVVHGDSDYVVHLGDYIYESGSGGSSIGRVPSKGKELASLDDYRQRYSQHRLDVDLQSMHQNLPIIAIWDDHETADNDWKAGSTDSNDSIASGGCSYSNNTVCLSDRALHAKRAYHEWIPIRQVDLYDQNRIWREFSFGDLVDVLALDTRKYDRDITDVNYNRQYVQGLAVELNSSRSITGPKQEGWLLDSLKESQERKTAWRMILNQVIFGSIDERWSSANPYAAGVYYADFDAWDGYQAERERIMQYIHDQQIDNVVVYTGDTHAFWLFENNLDTIWRGRTDYNASTPISTNSSSYQRGQVVEYGGTAVSSSGWASSYGSYDNSTTAGKALVENNAGLLYAEGFFRGYMNVEVNYTHLVTSYYGYPGNQQARVTGNRTLAARWVQEVGVNQVKRPLEVPKYGQIKSGN